MANALAELTFPPTPGFGFSPSLEGPHGNVHVLVGGPGGNMSLVSRAARDPIFWLHHGNIDRLWDRWINMGGGRVNPTDTTFLDQQYTFADETGGTETIRVGDAIGSAQLGYQYDSEPGPTAAVMGDGRGRGGGEGAVHAHRGTRRRRTRWRRSRCGSRWSG